MMKALLKKAKRKLKNENGESLAEVLVAVLVSALGMAMLASMITYAADIITRSKKHFNNYIEEENKLVGQTSGSPGFVKIGPPASGDGDLSTSVITALSAEDSNKTIDVTYFTNEEVEGKIIYTYKIRQNNNEEDD